MKKIISLIITLTLITAVLSGCGTPGQTGQPDHDKAASVSMELRTRTVETDSDSAIETKEFDLGAENYTSPYGREMPFNVRGTMSLPADNEKHTLAVILHGSHDNENPEAKIFEGFNYLAETLAKHGYAAVALDIQPAFVWEYGDGDSLNKGEYILDTFLQKLNDSISGENRFPLEVKGRIDTENIILIGHSCGGDQVLDYAGRNEFVSGVLAVAPPLIQMPEQARDIPTAMVVSELDGDVVSYSAYSYWPALKEVNLNSTAVITFADGANHNYYNDKLTNDDAEIIYADSDLANRITPEQQREFLEGYVLDFCDYCVNGSKEESLFDFSKTALNELNGVRIRSLYCGKQFSDCDVVNKSFDSQTLEIQKLFDSDSIHTDTMQAFEGGMSDINVLHIGWNEKQGSVPVYSSEDSAAAQTGAAITFAINPGDDRNEPGTSQSFSIDVIQKDGSMVKITLPVELPQMTCMTGKLYEDNYDGVDVKTWSRITPPSTILIPFDVYGLNAADVAGISMDFDRNEQGSVVLFSVETY